MPYVIGVQHRVAAEDVVLQNAREGPSYAAIGGVAPTGLPEIGGNAVELPPTDDHLIAIRGVHGD